MTHVVAMTRLLADDARIIHSIDDASPQSAFADGRCLSRDMTIK